MVVHLEPYRYFHRCRKEKVAINLDHPYLHEYHSTQMNEVLRVLQSLRQGVSYPAIRFLKSEIENLIRENLSISDLPLDQTQAIQKAIFEEIQEINDLLKTLRWHA